MNEIELVLALLVVVAALTPIARALQAPYPIVLVLGGLILALIPVVPDIPLAPELVFLLFLPPLVYSAAYSTSIRDLRVLVRPILSLAVGLVLATTIVVAVLVHAVLPELGWPAAFAFGAIVSPPDAVAAAAEALGFSGVLATVAAGLYLGWWEPYLSRSEARLRGRAVWEMVDFILNGLIFILIGLQLSTILYTLAGRSLIALVGLGLLVSLVVILVRLAWVFLDAYLRWWLVRPPRPADRAPRWRETFVVGWAGMRGVVSLAAALALPQAMPERDLLIFLTFVVILVTLVGQGLSLPWLIRALGLGADSSATAQQELRARRTAVEAAMAQIEQLRGQWPTHIPLIDSLQMQYAHRASHLSDPPGGSDGAGQAGAEPVDQELLEHHRIRRAVIDAERAALLNLRERGEIDDAVWRQIERDLDLEELRMDA